MVISSLSHNTLHGQAATGQPPVPAAAETPAAPSSQTSAIGAQANTGNPVDASSIVTLSEDATMLAGANAVGLSVAVSVLSSPDDSNSRSSTSDPLSLVKSVAARAFQYINRPFDEATQQHVGVISQSAFENEVEHLGGSESSAAALFTDIDTSANGFISDSELYTALGNIQSAPDSATSQALMHLMDASGDGSVSTAEYQKVELGLTDTEVRSDNA